MATETNSKIDEVYGVFRDYFGDEHVDLQPTASGEPAAHILVWWPEVTVTNENDRSITIQDLFARVPVNSSGQISWAQIQLNRSTYPYSQFVCGYMHSHVPRLKYASDFGQFVEPCLGNGPIRNTARTLRTDGSLEMWMLFCRELDMYVTVESLDGGPYINLESVGGSGGLVSFPYDAAGSSVLNRFVDILAKRHVKGFLDRYLRSGMPRFSFLDGWYQSGMTDAELVLGMSAAFIDYCNSAGCLTRSVWHSLLECHAVYTDCVVRDGRLFIPGNFSLKPLFHTVQGKPVCMFKGRQVCLKILDGDDSGSGDNTCTLLNGGVATFLFSKILETINFNYKKLHESDTAKHDGNTGGGTAPLVYCL